MKIKIEYKTNMKEERIRLRVTKQELATELSTTVKTITRIENGVQLPNVIHSIKIARYLGRTVEELFWD